MWPGHISLHGHLEGVSAPGTPQATLSGFHLRAVLGLDTLAGHQLGSQRLCDHKEGLLVSSSCVMASYCGTSGVCPGYRELYVVRSSPGTGALGSHSRSWYLDACLLGLMKLTGGLARDAQAAFLGAQCVCVGGGGVGWGVGSVAVRL